MYTTHKQEKEINKMFNKIEKERDKKYADRYMDISSKTTIEDVHNQLLSTQPALYASDCYRQPEDLHGAVSTTEPDLGRKRNRKQFTSNDHAVHIQFVLAPASGEPNDQRPRERIAVNVYCEDRTNVGYAEKEKDPIYLNRRISCKTGRLNISRVAARAREMLKTAKTQREFDNSRSKWAGMLAGLEVINMTDYA